MSDTLEKIALELQAKKNESWSERAEQRYESILFRFRSDLDSAIEAAYAAIATFTQGERLVCSAGERTAFTTKQQLFEALLNAPATLECIAYDALTDLEESADAKDSESILSKFQIAGLELLRDIEDIASAAPEAESEDTPSLCALTEQPFTIEG